MSFNTGRKIFIGRFYLLFIEHVVVCVLWQASCIVNLNDAIWFYKHWLHVVSADFVIIIQNALQKIDWGIRSREGGLNALACSITIVK